MQPRPVVGLSADLKLIAPHEYHCVGDKYVRAVAAAADAIPLILPAVADDRLPAEILALIDGLVLTGSYSNLHPRYYGGGEPVADKPTDPRRDATNLQLIPAAIDAGVPVFGICRGLQEMNVALGGSLHQEIHAQPGFDYHLEDPEESLDVQYGLAHPVILREGGVLAGLADALEQQVNSLHGQGIDRLAEGVVVEARAHDGLIEGFSVADAPAFALAVQWHPEWKPAQHPFYAAIWRAFGDACRDHARHKRRA